jgi:hypothetical protein
MSEERSGEMLVRREEAKHEKAKARLRSFEENMKATLTGLLQQENVRKSVAKDLMAATKDPSRVKSIHKKAAEGAYDNDELVTGFEERPWEND